MSLDWLPFLLAAAAAPASPAPQLRLPIDCAPGKTCFAQQYFDHDPGPGAKDYRCGSRVYDGHDGVDIRVPTVAAQQRGVAVLAAAGGKILRLRNDAPDQLIDTPADRAAVRGKECGNGVVVAMDGGWQAQYCHMARGSIAVKPGQVVKAGDRLGLVGLSGDTQFPHLHFSVRQGARKVDPFAPDAAPGACSPRDGRTLWTPDAAKVLAYRTTEIINLGFADAPVAMAAIEAESLRKPVADSPVLTAYGRAIGLQAGDRMTLLITDPKGAEVARNGTVMDSAKAQYMLFAGRKRPSGGWVRGRYTLTVTVLRGGQAVVSTTGTATL